MAPICGPRSLSFAWRCTNTPARPSPALKQDFLSFSRVLLPETAAQLGRGGLPKAAQLSASVWLFFQSSHSNVNSVYTDSCLLLSIFRLSTWYHLKQTPIDTYAPSTNDLAECYGLIVSPKIYVQVLTSSARADELTWKQRLYRGHTGLGRP